MEPRLFAAPRWILASSFLAFLAFSFPLFTYTTSLAAFGMAHVLAELRYVDARFSRRLSPLWITFLLAPLALICGHRAFALFAGTPGLPTLEVTLVGALAILAFCLLVKRKERPLPILVVLSLSILLWFGVFTAPAATLVTLAFAHNLTPLFFLVENLKHASKKHLRVRVFALCTCSFLVLPAAWFLWQFVSWQNGGDTSWDPDLFGTGPIERHIPVFVPSFLAAAPQDLLLFQLAVYYQGLHYALTIHVLPRMLSKREERETRLPWPDRTLFAQVLFLISVLFLCLFAISFGEARSFYGIFAAFHAWIEVPLLLLFVASAPAEA